MNERIKELKDQARDFYLNREDLNLTLHELHHAVEEKFAELIIKECVGVANNYYSPYYIGDKIKKHFGVE